MDHYRAAFLMGPRQIVLGSLPMPSLEPGEVLVRIHQANLCPTDLKKYYHLDEKSSTLLQKQGGVVLGHEAAGEIAALVPGVTGLQPGDRVAVDPMLPCGTCAYCQNQDFPMCQNLKGIGVSAGTIQDSLSLLSQGIGGVFADYIKVPAQNLYVLPDEMSYEAGAMMEPLADVLHSLEAGAPKPGETVVVFGLGAMGLMHVKVMQTWGIEHIIGVDPLPERRAKALEFGAIQVIDPQATDPVAFLKETTGGLGAEVIFVCAGGNAQVMCAKQALASIRKKGRILLYASALKPADLSVDINLIHYGMINFTGTVGFYRRHAEQALKILNEGSIDVNQLRTPIFPLDQLPGAFEIHNRAEIVKVGIDVSGVR